MRIIIVDPIELLKSNYTKRTGTPGNYKYYYGAKKKKSAPRPKSPPPTKRRESAHKKPMPLEISGKPSSSGTTGNVSVRIDANKKGWKVADAKKYGAAMSRKYPGKYVVMYADFGEVTFNVKNSLPSNPLAPGDFKYGYGLNGVWKDWSAKRKTTYSNKMLEGVE